MYFIRTNLRLGWGPITRRHLTRSTPANFLNGCSHPFLQRCDLDFSKIAGYFRRSAKRSQSANLSVWRN
jgi:hypothetical protein